MRRILGRAPTRAGGSRAKPYALCQKGLVPAGGLKRGRPPVRSVGCQGLSGRHGPSFLKQIQHLFAQGGVFGFQVGHALAQGIEFKGT